MNAYNDSENGEWPTAGRTGESGGALDVLLDMELPLMVRFGSARMLLGDLTQLSVGSVVELDRLAGNAVELLVNGVVIARGTPVNVRGNYGVRVSEIAAAPERIAFGAVLQSAAPVRSES